MRTLAAFAVLLLVAACQTAPPEMTEAEQAQIEAEVMEVMERAMEGIRQLDVDMIMSTVHPTDLGWVWSSVPRGHDRVRELWTGWIEDREAFDGEWAETTVKVFSPDAAAFQGIWGGTISNKSGRIVRYPDNASWTAVLERTPDGWKITMLDGGSGTVEVIQEAEG